MYVKLFGQRRLAGLVRGQEGSINRLHARRTCERSHEPVINALLVVRVQAWQKANGIPACKLQHADDTLAIALLSSILARIIDSPWKVLDKAQSLSNTHLLLLSQLCGKP